MMPRARPPNRLPTGGRGGSAMLPASPRTNAARGAGAGTAWCLTTYQARETTHSPTSPAQARRGAYAPPPTTCTAATGATPAADTAAACVAIVNILPLARLDLPATHPGDSSTTIEGMDACPVSKGRGLARRGELTCRRLHQGKHDRARPDEKRKRRSRSPGIDLPRKLGSGQT